MQETLDSLIKKVEWWFEQNDSAMYQDDWEIILISDFGKDGNLKLKDKVNTPAEMLEYWRRFKDDPISYYFLFFFLCSLCWLGFFSQMEIMQCLYFSNFPIDKH